MINLWNVLEISNKISICPAGHRHSKAHLKEKAIRVIISIFLYLAYKYTDALRWCFSLFDTFIGFCVVVLASLRVESRLYYWTSISPSCLFKKEICSVLELWKKLIVQVELLHNATIPLPLFWDEPTVGCYSLGSRQNLSLLWSSVRLLGPTLTILLTNRNRSILLNSMEATLMLRRFHSLVGTWWRVFPATWPGSSAEINSAQVSLGARS